MSKETGKRCNFILATKDRATGESRGVAIDVLHELGRRLGVPVEIVPYDGAAVMGDAVPTGRLGHRVPRLRSRARVPDELHRGLPRDRRDVPRSSDPGSRLVFQPGGTVRGRRPLDLH
jgi:hypothetical protein